MHSCYKCQQLTGVTRGQQLQNYPYNYFALLFFISSEFIRIAIKRCCSDKTLFYT